MNDIADIIIGRAPLTDIYGLLKDWRNNGDEKSRADYQDAIAATR